MRGAALLSGALGLVRVFLSRRRAREWIEWGAENPLEAAVQWEIWESFARHRRRVLSGRKWAFRQAHRVRRWASVEEECHRLGEFMRALEAAEGKRPAGMLQGKT